MENTSKNESLVWIELYKSDRVADISLTQLLADSVGHCGKHAEDGRFGCTESQEGQAVDHRLVGGSVHFETYNNVRFYIVTAFLGNPCSHGKACLKPAESCRRGKRNGAYLVEKGKVAAQCSVPHEA